MKPLIIFLLLVLFPWWVYASREDSVYFSHNYDKAEYLIPMRDGVKLFTIVYTPKNHSEKYPILLNRTPYSIAPYGEGKDFNFGGGLSPAYMHEGFIFVFQDVRGRFMSEGTFQHVTPFIANKRSNKDVDESSDAYDTMDWLLKNVDNHNGRIGMWGISYPGFYTSCAAINAHPALKCVSPQAPIGDWFFDDAHHHGAFFLGAMLDFLGAVDLPRHGQYKDWVLAYDWGTHDGYNFFKELGPIQNVKTRYFGDSIRFWNSIVDHPNYDEFWQKRNILPHLNNISPAVLIVGGWYDAEDLYGTFKTYKNIESQNPGIKNSVVIGPWYHGGWARNDGASLGNVSFGSKTSVFFRDSVELPFFNYYLKDKGSLNLPEATMFMTGRNEWKKFDTWPPKEVTKKRLFLQNDGSLSFVLKKPPLGFDEFISDPAKPVPYSQDIFFGMKKEYMVDDQRFAASRPDVLVYSTDVLTEDVTLAGSLMAHLKVSTTGTDADWVIKLIDVYPNDAPDNPTTRPGMKMGGYQQMVRSEVMRGRFRKSYEHPEPFQPGKIDDINLEMQDVLHCFKKGHRIMVQVQSSWFPLVDMNPQKYVENIYKAEKGDFIKATHRVYHDGKNNSFIEVGVLEK
ncbi:MAG TPA: CocE/NonD family hydrolase [Bacteroidales bacterium]|nr:CocE/NonD family hydrolase [Bacteroidales bacterium]